MAQVEQAPVEQAPPDEERLEHLEHHPTDRQYVKVAIILSVVTAIEVAIYYVPALRSLLIPMLLAFAFIKFVMVALWFMHLRFDSRIFRRFFITGIILALAVFAAVLTIFFLSLGGPAPTVE